MQKQAQQAQASAPVETGLTLEQIRFQYAVSGDSPPWKPLRAFDDGERVHIQLPGGIAQGELPPLFVIGPQGDGQLVNYRFRSSMWRTIYLARLNCGWAATRRKWYASSAHMRSARPRAEELNMTASDTSTTAPAATPKVGPESVASRASPRPVTRLNRRMLAFGVGVGAVAAGILGGTFWSLQSNIFL